jgi:hypothetical protein
MKKTKSDIYLDFARYKWEFLRRNPDYIKEWEELYSTPKLKYDIKRLNKELTHDEIGFSIDWEIMFPANPKLSYNELVASLHDSNYDWAYMFPELMSGFSDNSITTIPNYIEATKDILKSGKVKIELDLSYPKTELLKNLGSLIDEWKHLYKKLQKNKPVKIKVRERNKYRFGDFDEHLKYYDEKITSGLSWKQIAKKYSLRDIQTARNHYNSARLLIKKGISLYAK